MPAAMLPVRRNARSRAAASGLSPLAAAHRPQQAEVDIEFGTDLCAMRLPLVGLCMQAMVDMHGRDPGIKLVTHGAQRMQQHVRIQAATVGHLETRPASG